MEKIKSGFHRLIHWQYFPLLVLIVVILGLHFATITSPNTPLFDEQHYVPDARRILSGEGTQRIEQPPLAKLIIAGGIELIGDNPWGWRMPSVIFGTLALVALFGICRKLGTSRKTAFLATLLLGTENLMFIHSGIAMLDIFEVSFAIFAFWFYLNGPRWWWLSALMVAMAALCKFNGILAIIPIGLHWIIIGYKPNMGTPAEALVEAPPETGPPVEDVSEQSPAEQGTTSPGENTELPLLVAESTTPAATGSPVAAEPYPEGAPPAVPEEPQKRSFWQTYSRPIIFILSMLVAPVAFFLLYGVFDMIIWGRYIPFVVWGHWDAGVVGVIKNALNMTDSIKFSYTGAFPARPWEWVLSPTGSFYFYGWLFHPQNYENILLPYWYTPSYTGMLSPSLWLAGLFVIPYAAVKSFLKKHNPEKNAAIFVVCWIIGTWVVWIPLFMFTDRITYTFYYLPTVGAIAIGAALILAGFLKRIERRTSGFRKHLMQLGVTSFLLFHLLSFCVLSPLHLYISIPVCTLLLFFTIGYLGFGWRFNTEFFISANLALLIMRFGLYWPLRGWLVTENAPWGLPEVSMLWVVSTLIGLVITFGLYAALHLFANKVFRDNAPPDEAARELARDLGMD